MKTRFTLSILFIILLQLTAQEYTQSFIAIKDTGVEQFHEEFPDYDGRGTIIFIFDTGVDMGIDGLVTTSTGEIKVIDAQDFTGQGDIKYYEADTDEEDDIEYFVNEDEGYKVKGAGKLSLSPIDDEYFIGVLPEKLWLNSGSHISDINGNGKTDDLFYFVTFKVKTDESEYWVVYFDTNDDGDLSDEEPFRNYKDSLKPMFIKTNDNFPLLTFAINIFPEEQKVSFFFDDGSHGTHCAGIASGCNIGGNGFNGVAPGANVIACKIGNNNFSGGATVTGSMEKAFKYADKISREVSKPCVISMSYGVGSEIEGHSEMEQFLAKLVSDNPYIYISLSNSNEGPGISSTGMPSSSSSVLSSGAVLTKEVGSDAYGAVLDRDVILHFSSRGGSVLKPDIVSPGAAIATVPNHSKGDRMWGTSMAAPYSTGVLSLLLSAAKSEFPDVKIPSLMLYKVVRESAVPMEGYVPVDQGSGYINVAAAWKLLKKYIKAGEIDKFETYTVRAFAPDMPRQTAEGLYIRNGAFLNGTESFIYKIRRNDFHKRSKFYRTYNLRSGADWLIPAQKKLHIRNDQLASVDVSFDKSILSKPGLYNAKIYATRADKSGTPEFELMATVVIPYLFNTGNGYFQTWNNIETKPADHQRYFLKVPAGTSDIRIKIHSAANEYTHLRYFLNDNDGRQILAGVFNAGTQEDFFETYFMNPGPGVYELDIVGYYTDQVNSIYNLTVDMDGIENRTCGKYIFGKNTLKLENVFNEVKKFDVDGEVLGYKKTTEFKLGSGAPYELKFRFNEGESDKKFDLKLSKVDYNKLTDFALVIYNEAGKAIRSNALSYSFADISLHSTGNKDAEYTLKLIPGFASAGNELDVKLTDYTSFNSPTKFIIKQKYITLYPTSVKNLDIEITKPDYPIPADALYWGKCYLKNPGTGKTETEFQLLLNN